MTKKNIKKQVLSNIDKLKNNADKYFIIQCIFLGVGAILSLIDIKYASLTIITGNFFLFFLMNKKNNKDVIFNNIIRKKKTNFILANSLFTLQKNIIFYINFSILIVALFNGLLYHNYENQTLVYAEIKNNNINFYLKKPNNNFIKIKYIDVKNSEKCFDYIYKKEILQGCSYDILNQEVILKNSSLMIYNKIENKNEITILKNQTKLKAPIESYYGINLILFNMFIPLIAYLLLLFKMDRISEI